jgi:hypothetical protein
MVKNILDEIAKNLHEPLYTYIHTYISHALEAYSQVRFINNHELP